MKTRKSAVIFVLALAALTAWAGTTLYVLDTMTPRVEKKPVTGLEVKDGGFHFRNQAFDLTVIPMNSGSVQAYYFERKLTNPFEGLRGDENMVFFRVRIENLQKSGKLAFSPKNTMMGNSMPFDEIKVYQLLYRSRDSDQLLASAGKTLFFRNLLLPAHTWIERILLYQYDDPYPTKNINLIFGSIATDRASFEVIFPFKAHFVKEKL